MRYLKRIQPIQYVEYGGKRYGTKLSSKYQSELLKLLKEYVQNEMIIPETYKSSDNPLSSGSVNSATEISIFKVDERYLYVKQKDETPKVYKQLEEFLKTIQKVPEMKLKPLTLEQLIKYVLVLSVNYVPPFLKSVSLPKELNDELIVFVQNKLLSGISTNELNVKCSPNGQEKEPNYESKGEKRSQAIHPVQPTKSKESNQNTIPNGNDRDARKVDNSLASYQKGQAIEEYLKNLKDSGINVKLSLNDKDPKNPYSNDKKSKPQ